MTVKANPTGAFLDDSSTQNVTGAKTFTNQTLIRRNPAGTFSLTEVHPAITANYNTEIERAFSYTIYKTGTTIKAMNMITGAIEFSGTVADVVIQAAINALGTFSGKAIFIKNGTYDLTASLNPTIPGGNFDLVGESRQAYLKPSGNFPALTISGKSSVNLHHLGFLHAQTGYTSSLLKIEGAAAASSAHNRINHCRFEDTSGSHVGNAIELDSTNGSIYDNIFFDIYTAGFENAIHGNMPNTTYFMTSNEFKECYFNMGQRVLKYDGAVSSTNFDGNRFSDCTAQCYASSLDAFDYNTTGRALYSMHTNVMVWDLPAGKMYATGNAVVDLSLVNCYPSWLIGGALATSGRLRIFDQYIRAHAGAITSADSPYSIGSVDANGVLRADASGGAITINLPTAVAATGREYHIFRTDIASSTNIITIDANSTETIDSNLTYRLYAGEWVRLQSDGANWQVIGRSNPTAQGYYFLKGSTADRRYLFGVGQLDQAYLTSTSSPAQDTLWAFPMIISKTTKFDKIEITVTTASTAGNSRFGIYADNGNNYPGALIFDSGVVDTHTSTGIKDVTITSSVQVLQPGLYWGAYVQDTATGQYRILSGGSTMIGLMGYANQATLQPWHYNVAHVFAALPNPYTGGGTLSNVSSAVATPLVAVGLRAV